MTDSNDLVPVEQVSPGGIMPLVSPDQAKAAMAQYLALCEAVLMPEDYQIFEQREKVNGKWQAVQKKFKKKSAVKKLQTFFGVSVKIVSQERDDMGDGHFGFRVVACATMKNGREVDATGACSTFEERFDVQRKDDESEPAFEWRRRKALARSYHDVLSTAETRASNRAVMNAIGVGGGEVTADEISRERTQAPSRQAAPPPAQGPTMKDVNALADSLGFDPHGLREFSFKHVPTTKDLDSRNPRVLKGPEVVALLAALRAYEAAQDEAAEIAAQTPPQAPAASVASPGDDSDPFAAADAAGLTAEPGMTPDQRRKLQAMCNARFHRDRAARLAWASGVIFRTVDSFDTVTLPEASKLIDELERLARVAS